MDFAFRVRPLVTPNALLLADFSASQGWGAPDTPPVATLAAFVAPK